MGGYAKAEPYIKVDGAHLALTGTSDLEPASKAEWFDPNELDIGSDGMVYFRATDISGKAYWLMVPVGEQAVCLALLWSYIDPNKKRIALRTVLGNGDGPLAFYGGGDDDSGKKSPVEKDYIALAFCFGHSGLTLVGSGEDAINVDGRFIKFEDVKTNKHGEQQKILDSFKLFVSNMYNNIRSIAEIGGKSLETAASEFADSYRPPFGGKFRRIYNALLSPSLPYFT